MLTETIIAMRTRDLNATDFIFRGVEEILENRTRSSGWRDRAMEISGSCERREAIHLSARGKNGLLRRCRSLQ
jgi:hypothetical protein